MGKDVTWHNSSRCEYGGYQTSYQTAIVVVGHVWCLGFSSRLSPGCRVVSLSFDAYRVCSMPERSVIVRCTSTSWHTRLRNVYVTIISAQRTIPSGSLLARAVLHLHLWYTRLTAPTLIRQMRYCIVGRNTSSRHSTFLLRWIALASPCIPMSVV